MRGHKKGGRPLRSLCATCFYRFTGKRVTHIEFNKVTRARARACARARARREKGTGEMNDVFLQRVASGARFIFVIKPLRGSRNRNPDNGVPIKLNVTIAS